MNITGHRLATDGGLLAYAVAVILRQSQTYLACEFNLSPPGQRAMTDETAKLAGYRCLWRCWRCLALGLFALRPDSLATVYPY